MDKDKAIELLRQELTKIPQLRQLHYDDQQYRLWRDKVENIIQAGLESEDAMRFSSSIGSVKMRGFFSDDVYQQEYLEKLNKYETALKSIIQKYEMLGIEEKPTAMAEPKDTAESPVYLFDKMQFHPKVIAVSKSLFETEHYSQAIFEAFKAVNNFVKEKTSRTEDGKDLMAKVFNENAPIIKLNDSLTQSDKDEQEGFKFLFMGAMVGIRNPKAHESVVQRDLYGTLEYLALASLLMKRVEEGKVSKLQKGKDV